MFRYRNTTKAWIIDHGNSALGCRFYIYGVSTTPRRANYEHILSGANRIAREFARIAHEYSRRIYNSSRNGLVRSVMQNIDVSLAGEQFLAGGMIHGLQNKDGWTVSHFSDWVILS